ncbi:MAG: tetratricopeptide repeat protein [Armatimonadetes bacterium]|nr:tetratricopeptide repeat protein [Armatimonadota bacterium]
MGVPFESMREVALGEFVPIVLLLTDIEGSTRMWEHFPAQMALALDRHNNLAEQSVSKFGGKILKKKGEGDSLFIVFSDPIAAVNASIDIQSALRLENWPSEIQIKVRMSIHCGTAIQGDMDYFGPMVNRCARIRGVAFGGQVVASEAVVLATRDRLEPPAAFVDLGLHRLKDLQIPERIFQVTHPEIEETFGPLASLNAFPNNLPFQTSAFVGRETEIEHIRTVIADNRLVTLKGTGGTGKTRLALQVAAELVSDFSAGVWAVELASLSDESVLLTEVARALGIPDSSEHQKIERIAERFRDQPGLLILDNCEHLLRGASKLVQNLLAQASQLKVVATSREPLQVPGEKVIEVAPLEKVDPSGDLDLIEASPAVQLFIDRASLANPQFASGEETVRGIARICGRLDGIPLAIELAAARSRTMSIAQIEERLAQRFRLLGASAQSQSLHDVIDWSYQSLTPFEQELLSRLSVFQGGASLAAAEVVCAREGEDPWEIGDALTRLVDKSLLVLEYGANPRYHMLESIREFAATKLGAATEEFKARHRDYYLTSSAEFAEIEEDHDNFRAVFDNLREASDPRIADFVLKLAPFWETRGYLSEARIRLRQVLSVTLGPIAALHNCLGSLARKQGDLEEAQIELTEALRLSELASDLPGQATALANLASVATVRGDLPVAEDLSLRALAMSEELGNKPQQVRQYIILANISERRDSFIEAEDRLKMAITIGTEAADKGGLLYAFANLGLVCAKQNKTAEARSAYTSALKISRELGEKYTAGLMLTFISQLLRTEGLPGPSLQLLLAARVIRQDLQIVLPPDEQEEENSELTELEELLGNDAEQVRIEAKQWVWPTIVDQTLSILGNV